MPTISTSGARQRRQDHGQRRFQPQRPDKPIIPYIEGDGTGVDITPVMLRSSTPPWPGGLRRQAQDPLDGVYAGREVDQGLRPDVWLPERRCRSSRLRGVDQGPADHAGRRRHPSLNVALRQELDLYVCLRPVRWFKGVPSPVKEPKGRHGDLPRELRGHLRRHPSGRFRWPQAKR